MGEGDGWGERGVDSGIIASTQNVLSKLNALHIG